MAKVYFCELVQEEYFYMFLIKWLLCDSIRIVWF